MGIRKWDNSRIIDKQAKYIKIRNSFFLWKYFIKPNKDKYKKANAWLMEVPIGFAIKSGCLAKSSYKRKPMRLPGNKYKIIIAVKEK